MSTDKKSRITNLNGILAIIVFLVIGAIALVIHVTAFSPVMASLPEAPRPVADRAPMRESMSTNAVLDRYHSFVDFGSRAPGQNGLEQARQAILSTFREYGLEVYEQDVDVPYPLLREDSGYVQCGTNRVAVWPFMPNHAIPVSTGADGLDGELFLASADSIRNGNNFDGKIAVVDLGGSVFEDIGLDLFRYADMGFAAVIVTHSEGLSKAAWDEKMWLSTSPRTFPVNLVRLAAGPEILDLIGKHVHIDARSVWGNRRTHNIIGVMRGTGSVTNKEALIIPVEYDAVSLLPDMAYGSLQALQTAVLLQAVEGLSHYRDTFNRDVIFVASSGIYLLQGGLSRLVSTMGENGRRDYPRKRITQNIAENDAASAKLDEIMKLFDDPAFAVPGSVAKVKVGESSLSPAARKYFDERFGNFLRKAVFIQSENQLQAKISYQRNPDNLVSPEFHRFRIEKKLYDDLNNLSALPFSRALERKTATLPLFPMPDGSRGLLRDAFKAELERFVAFHKDRAKSLEADLALQTLFASYDDFLTFGPRCSPSATDDGNEKIGYSGGRGVSRGEGFELFGTILNEVIYDLGYRDEVDVVKGEWNGFINIYSEFCDLNTMPFGIASYPGYSIVSAKEKAKHVYYPFRQEVIENISSVHRLLQVFGEMSIRLAEGRGSFKRLPIWGPKAFRGTVFASGVGNSTVPNFAVEGALVCSRDQKPPLITDIYGNYENQFMLLPCFSWVWWRSYDAFFFDENGIVKYAKDYGSAAQLIYASKGMRFNNVPINHVLYRATPVAILNRTNPQTLKWYSDFLFIKTKGLSAFPSTCCFDSDWGFVDYLPPDERFFLLLKDGALDNELVSTTRAFCLGTTHTNDPAYKPSENEIDGPGYLAQDTPVLHNVSYEAMESMAWLARKRLELQTKYSMADEMTLMFERNSEEISKDISEHGSEKTYFDLQQRVNQGLSYQTLNHPVIRGSISEAVAGILWYLGLLVPFIFFFEKLTFGFTDIRKQLIVHGITFVAVFSLLRVLHPAFKMIRSSAMILLGFVIILTVGTVTIILSGKFKENLDHLRSAQGGVKGVSGDKLGIIGTAFMLGLNNMHRRKVRTGLTCVTLVLMTFVMICFTSVHSNIVETERAVGSADYQGIVIRKKQFRPIQPAEVNGLRTTFQHHKISCRKFYASYYDHTTQLANVPKYELTCGEGESTRSIIVHTALGFDSTEPLRDKFKMLCTNGWFTAEQQHRTEAPYPIILSDVMSEQLGITPEEVNKEPVPITLNGTQFVVYNIFDSMHFGEVVDVDGENMLPFDGQALSNPKFCGWCVLMAERDDPRVAAADVVLVINDQVTMDGRGTRVASVVVDMSNVPFATAKSEISMYQERSGAETSYALGGMAYNGRRARFRSLAGFTDLLIPLIIAALTVLNTMKGSVYERRGEIFVYNAVGIAPKYIFFMFVAEALVYSVVGAVLGYLLSQGTGRILSAYHLTGGMNMNFATSTTIYASLAIAAATLISTIFPARAAMEIAKPADNSGWALPEPDADDRMTIMLPFTFTHYDRIAVLAFFYNFFDGFGEGSAGIFFAGEPVLKIADHTDDLANGAYIPEIEVQVWLKPYDLGVSQKLVIELGTDPETKEYIAKMILIRVTGTRESWTRLNKSFVAVIRQHFLHWRAVPQEQKTTFFAQAKKLLRQQLDS